MLYDMTRNADWHPTEDVVKECLTTICDHIGVAINFTRDIHSTSEQVIITVFPFFILSVASQLAAA